MNPVLKKLRGPSRSLVDVADMLEQHVGDGTNELLCKEALDALRRVRRESPTYYLKVALRVLDTDASACEQVRRVIAILREWRFYSGV